MAEFRNRTPMTALVVGLVAFAIVAMVVDRRSAPGGPERELSGWSGAVLDIAAPVQKMISFPFDLTQNAWRHYVSLLDASDNNEGLRARLAVLEEENLQLREALIASGRLERIAEIRAGDTWRNIAAQLETIKVVEYDRAGARVHQTTEIRPEVAKLLDKLGVKPPPKVLSVVRCPES